ncbi:MAG: PAS domain-containing protein [Clostridiales Family XIII bacterium]|jgi:two-component system sensor histidine kinase VicK|nr:PAS domain-containing protein [Clostridiales Family XIII bacterium]
MKHRKDDLVGIRKARFASFVLLIACFAAMLVIAALAAGRAQIYAASGIAIAVFAIGWWFAYRRILYSEAVFFEALSSDMRGVHHRLRMLESAVRQIGDGVVIVADDGDFVLANETAKRLLAAFDGDLNGVRYDEYAAGFSEKLERAAILAAAQESKPSEIVTVDGRFYKIGIVALVPEEGKGQGAVAVISDVTENTNAERMQKDFVANVSHELKTPLASVKSYAETLIEGAAEDIETMQEFLGIIVSEADRMDRLVKDLMYLVRADYQTSFAEAAESDLPSLVKVSMKKLDMLAREKQLSVNRMFSEDLRANIEMDRDRIEQVILNILGNAIKYTEEKGRVDVDIISGQNCVQIVISDNGVGIPEKALPRVFERFFRVDNARTGKMGGTGLGLAISRQIIDTHDGTIGIESKAGRGTTVTVTLPSGKTRGTPGIL